MAKQIYPFFLLMGLLSIHSSSQVPLYQSQALLRIQQLLNLTYPSILSSWSTTTDFCNIEPNPSFTPVCYEDSITQLHLIGNNGVSPLLPQKFSVDSFFAALVTLSSLKVLSLGSLGLWGPLPACIGNLSSLEILNMSSNYFSGTIPREVSSLRNLQTLILDHNFFTGQVPDWLSSLTVLAVLSLKNNSFTGSLPNSLSRMESLRIITFSMNHLSGEVPDLHKLTNLQVLDLEGNYFGPHFPRLHTKLVTLVLRNNRFRFGIPSEFSSYYQLQKLDISLNRFAGPFLPSLLSLPSITYLDIAGNKFTGMLFQNMSCSAELVCVNLSSNLLTGDLPTCLQLDSKNRVVLFAKNCLSNGDGEQLPYSFCHSGALAVKISPLKQRKSRPISKEVLSSSIVGGIALVGLVFLVVRRVDTNTKNTKKMPPTRLISENVSTEYRAKLLSEARYISQTMKLGALGLPAYRTFYLEELKEATNNFDNSSFIGEGSHGQIYRGRLTDGTLVSVRSLKMRKRHSTQSYTHHIELISKIRHFHLVSALGHCFECYPDDSSVRRIFLIFEFIPNGTLRGCISEGLSGQKLTWTRRIAAALEVAKGIQFLHTGIVPGVFSNNLKITDVLLDQNLNAKISSYNLPLLAENRNTVDGGVSSIRSKESARERVRHEDKNDIYDLGIILLEIIVGRPIMSQYEVGIVKDLFLASTTADDIARKSIIDPAIKKECSDESLKMMMELCIRCISNEPTDRPSVEDVIWNLQFAAQVQVSWKGDSQSNQDSLLSSSQ